MLKPHLTKTLNQPRRGLNGETMPADMTWMKQRFDELNEKSLLWEPPTLEGPNQPRCTMEGKPTIMLSANNYLNLTTHPKVVQAMARTDPLPAPYAVVASTIAWTTFGCVVRLR